MSVGSHLPTYELSLFQRMLLIWLFIACGLVVTLQLSQSYAEPRPKWTVLNDKNKPYWYTFHAFTAFLLMQISYNTLRWNLEGLLGGYEVAILDAVWIGLLGLEAFMLVSVFVLRIKMAMKMSTKVKEL